MIIGILILLILYSTIPSFRNTLKFSIEKLFSKNDSLEARKESIIKPLQLYLVNPILGHKYINVVEITPHNTNTTINMFAIYGIIAGIVHLILLYLFVKKLEQPKIVTILIFIILIISINTQFLIGNVVLWIFMFSYFMRDKTILQNQNEIVLKKSE